MALDHYLTLGRSGLRVSPLCLGTMTFGEDLGWGSSVEESQAIMDRYFELGGNFLDTGMTLRQALEDFVRERSRDGATMDVPLEGRAVREPGTKPPARPD